MLPQRALAAMQCSISARIHSVYPSAPITLCSGGIEGGTLGLLGDLYVVVASDASLGGHRHTGVRHCPTRLTAVPRRLCRLAPQVTPPPLSPPPPSTPSNHRCACIEEGTRRLEKAREIKVLRARNNTISGISIYNQCIWTVSWPVPQRRDRRRLDGCQREDAEANAAGMPRRARRPARGVPRPRHAMTLYRPSLAVPL